LFSVHVGLPVGCRPLCLFTLC